MRCARNSHTIWHLFNVVDDDSRSRRVADDFAPGVHDADVGGAGEGDGVGERFAIGDGDEASAGDAAELFDGLAEGGRGFDLDDQVADVDVEAVGDFGSDAVTLDEAADNRRMCFVCHDAHSGITPKERISGRRWMRVEETACTVI